MKFIFKWIFKEEWKNFESEMRSLEWEHYVSHRWELEQRDKEILKLKNLLNKNHNKELELSNVSMESVYSDLTNPENNIQIL